MSLTRLDQDLCSIHQDENVSQSVGRYTLKNFDWTPKSKITGVMNNSRVIPNTSTVAIETVLQHAPLTNLKGRNELFTRPYLGSFSGAGTHTRDQVQLESALLQGVTTATRNKACEVTRDVSTALWQFLPEFGNPQRVEHIIPPDVRDGGWVRGGTDTRDYVRRVDYQTRCSKPQANYTVTYPRPLPN